MASNQQKILSVEEKVKVIREILIKKINGLREFGLVNSRIQTICKNRTKNLMFHSVH